MQHFKIAFYLTKWHISLNLQYISINKTFINKVFIYYLNINCIFCTWVSSTVNSLQFQLCRYIEPQICRAVADQSILKNCTNVSNPEITQPAMLCTCLPRSLVTFFLNMQYPWIQTQKWQILTDFAFAFTTHLLILIKRWVSLLQY